MVPPIPPPTFSLAVPSTTFHTFVWPSARPPSTRQRISFTYPPCNASPAQSSYRWPQVRRPPPSAAVVYCPNAFCPVWVPFIFFSPIWLTTRSTNVDSTLHQIHVNFRCCCFHPDLAVHLRLVQQVLWSEPSFIWVPSATIEKSLSSG